MNNYKEPSAFPKVVKATLKNLVEVFLNKYFHKILFPVISKSSLTLLNRMHDTYDIPSFWTKKMKAFI